MTGRSRYLLALMVASLILTILLGWQAQDAARSHHATAEQVLRDYAALAADEFVRRTTNQVGYYGYYPLITALAAQSAAADPATLPGVEQVRQALDERSRPALDLAASFFVVPLSSEKRPLCGAPDRATCDWLLEHFRGVELDALRQAQGFTAVHGEIAGSAHSFVYQFVDGASPHLIGFEVDRGTLTAWFRQTYERAPLLPESLTRGEDADSWITLSVHDGTGEQLFGSHESYSGYTTVYREFGDAYNGILSDLRVTSAVDPAAASQLIIGGLPYSRLPLLFLLFALTVGLLIAAIYQLRRERALSQLRSDFVSRVSHELRTPLTQIRMFAETLLLDRVRSPVERKRSLQIIDKEARRLTHLVENILQFSRGERGTMRLELRDQPLAPLVDELVEGFRPLAGNGTVTLTTRIDDLSLPLDEEAMRQVLLNLLDNAVKYGPAEQEIAIDTRRHDGVVELRVDDEGPGVPAADREKIWQRFKRLDRDAGSATAGTGIGLAVVRELVALHGGRTWVEQGRSGGARFVVELPLETPA